jgi:hypothetical protein
MLYVCLDAISSAPCIDAGLNDRNPLQPLCAPFDARFQVLEQKYIEALASGDTSTALSCLRKEMAALGNDARLHKLAALIMCPLPSMDRTDPAGISHNPWLSDAGVNDVSCGGGRRAVLRKLQSLLPPNLMLPERRLECLVEQALQAQVC